MRRLGLLVHTAAESREENKPFQGMATCSLIRRFCVWSLVVVTNHISISTFLGFGVGKPGRGEKVTECLFFWFFFFPVQNV